MVFGSSFAGARLAAAGAVGHEIVREPGEESAAGQAAIAAGAEGEIRPGLQGIQRRDGEVGRTGKNQAHRDNP